MDYLVNVIWPGFSHHGAGQVRKAYAVPWLRRSYNNPALRHALLMASSVHLGTNCTNLTDQQQLGMMEEQLFHQNKAISYIRKVLASPARGNWDASDVVMVIICLATNPVRTSDDEEVYARDTNPFSAPLQDGGWINIYGACDISQIHWNAILHVIESAGGIENVGEFGIPWVIS